MVENTFSCDQQESQQQGQQPRLASMGTTTIARRNMGNNDNTVATKVGIDLNLRPQNLDFETYFKLTKEYEDLRS